MSDTVDHPAHYTGRNIGYECIVLAKHQCFCTGNTIKYLWRYKSKGNPVEDLMKARWYALRATTRQEQIDTTGRCGLILRRLIASTEGFEKVAWLGLAQSDWHLVREALDRMIEKENK